MSLTTLTYIAADLIALAVLVGALYAPRHARKDLMAAYIGVNVGVLAVTLLLSTASVAASLGLGLFGVLSIIRLRSTELAQHEVAYFFAALALGLLGGIETARSGWWRPSWAPSSPPCGSATTPRSCAATVTR